ncbi:MAG: alpha-isopropylmalate synthase regulatory domain-containing protein, partial [Myxococcota bacterium]
GIHQDGMLKHHETYEIMRPEAVGAARTELVLGKHSGKHAFAVRMKELGYPLLGADMLKAFERFKRLADKKKRITDADLIALVSDELYQPREYYRLEGLQVGCGTSGLPTAAVRVLGPDGETVTEAAPGTGPVDAVYKAIDRIVKSDATLLEYTVQSVTEGIDALGEVSVRIRAEEVGTQRLSPQHGNRAQVFHGHGADTDIIVASAKAYVAALNRLLSVVEAQAEAAAEQQDPPPAPLHAKEAE